MTIYINLYTSLDLKIKAKLSCSLHLKLKVFVFLQGISIVHKRTYVHTRTIGAVGVDERCIMHRIGKTETRVLLQGLRQEMHFG